jgi:hypothetical protein
MTTGEYTPLLRSGSSRSSANQHHIPINSHYYDITDIESWPIAGLLVMLDGRGQPVRAELHLYDELQPHGQEAAIRQARLVLQERYVGGTPVPVRILETFQVREEMIVRLPPLGARPMSVPTMPPQWRQYGLIAGAALGVVLLVWLVIALVGSGQPGDSDLVQQSTPAATVQQVNEAVAATAVTTGDQSDVVAVEEALAAPGGGDLPVSRNARGDLRIGMRIQAVPGLRVALRTEPGLDSGTVIGELADGDSATIVGGPEYRQGDFDTIVWWFVESPNGVQAWAAANTSDQTLLMPVP